MVKPENFDHVHLVYHFTILSLYNNVNMNKNSLEKCKCNAGFAFRIIT